jgi:tetratricopeptide (TPR) repeat protein
MKSYSLAPISPGHGSNVLGKAFASIVVLTLIFFTLEGGAARSAKAAERCNAERAQLFIDQGRYRNAISEFTCVIEAQPTDLEGYRGRIEAELLIGRYSDAVRDYQRVIAFVLPVHPDAKETILAGYAARLAIAPDNIPALTGASATHWWFFDYKSAIPVLNQLLAVRPNDYYGNLFRGSSRLLLGVSKAKGIADLERAIALDPENPHVRFIVADAYTYGLPDPQRAFDEATLALSGGLNTPRIQAILATSYQAFGNQLAAAVHIKTHIDLVTSELLAASPLAAANSQTLQLVPGRTFEIPIPANAGETISIATSSPDFYDTIMVLLAPDGTPVIASDDANFYFAAFEYVAPVGGTYRLQVTSFESVNTGELVVTRN